MATCNYYTILNSILNYLQKKEILTDSIIVRLYAAVADKDYNMHQFQHICTQNNKHSRYLDKILIYYTRHGSRERDITDVS